MTGPDVLAWTGAALHALLRTRATAAHPWLFAAPDPTRRPSAMPATDGCDGSAAPSGRTPP
ncbi:hypothetical protein JHL17_32790 [Azospirillum sp. YIM B02556]|uniref:Uncharacterized protein n=1 Tax=Azospirillum endophyticum TaxID=2800326 RepID=A0ABS1FFH2_9PROT|nr:hypothetical protein [Azospirillum endophyticum]MBK1842184.1 hypothetical protein [Azospirillum endophyticum]